MAIELSTDEIQVLDDLLSERLGDLKEQIYKTEVAEYKDSLKQREKTLMQLLERVRGLRAGSTSPT